MVSEQNELRNRCRIKLSTTGHATACFLGQPFPLLHSSGAHACLQHWQLTGTFVPWPAKACPIAGKLCSQSCSHIRQVHFVRPTCMCCSSSLWSLTSSLLNSVWSVAPWLAGSTLWWCLRNGMTVLLLYLLPARLACTMHAICKK